MLAYDILGLIGSFMISASLVPQILKIYRTKSAKDLSRSFQLLYVAGLILLVVYGVGESLWPIYIPVVIELAGGATLLVMKFIYDGRDAVITEKERVDGGEVDLEAGALEGSTYKLALTPN